ncbi:fasciclin domain-containing protein [Neolewinella antarctica]|uniref:Transforming growth factor-beta-induced protein n=1 Tax=Neolewinella antarctica TaxID=442734 RepID=A0ABX0XG00_9BACT|nr:fasciclin domain-containing protein [Neolewinella antarctica]NJC27677.1 transforming growth factor-beta-induced protein [Neolewinella antarctica]
MFKLSSPLLLAILAIFALGFSSCEDDDDTDAVRPNTISAIVDTNDDFTLLRAALEQTDLDDVLDNVSGNFTVFAPTDAAFAAANIDAAGLAAMDNDTLSNILLYHVLGARVLAADIAAGTSFPTTLNETGPDDAPLSLVLNNANGAVTVNGSTTVTTADVAADNGVIHIIDEVLMAQNIVQIAQDAPGLSTLVSSLGTASLVEALSDDGPFTVFAPTNAAFTAIDSTVATLTVPELTNILTYHVVNGNVRADGIPSTANTLLAGEGLTFGGTGNTTITTTSDPAQNVEISSANNIQGTNGVVHLIPTVLLPTNF